MSKEHDQEVLGLQLQILWVKILDFKPMPLYFSNVEGDADLTFFVTGFPYIMTQPHIAAFFSFFGTVKQVIVKEFALRSAQPHWSVGGPRHPRYAEVVFGSYPEKLINYREMTLYFNGKEVSDNQDNVPLEYNFVSLLGMYTQAYARDTCMPPNILAEIAEIFVRKYDTYLEQQKERPQKDEDGWKILTPNSKYYKNKYVYKNKIMGIDEEYTAMKLKQMNQKMIEKGFYKFQQVERKQDDLMRLRQRHADDKERISMMRHAGRLNPFLCNMK